MPEPTLCLVIGNKIWSSWSLRPWLVLKHFQIPFEEINVKLRQSDSKSALLAQSPAGKVPVLRDGDMLIWDSLAIIEYVAELYPDRPIWPRDRLARGVARAISAEMHAGFQQLREVCPMELFASKPMTEFSDGVEHNIRRIVQSFRDCRAEYGRVGPFLFGAFTAADAMYAPVCSRFRTYVPDLQFFGDDGTAKAYVETIFAMPEMTLWAATARAESAHESSQAKLHRPTQDP
jgi:glutathione S-transferase